MHVVSYRESLCTISKRSLRTEAPLLPPTSNYNETTEYSLRFRVIAARQSTPHHNIQLLRFSWLRAQNKDYKDRNFQDGTSYRAMIKIGRFLLTDDCG